MQIETTKTTLANAVSRVSRAISASRANDNAAFGCVLVEGAEGKVKLTGTNGDILISTEIACEVSQPTNMAVPAGLLNKLLSALPEGVLEIDYDSKALKVEVKSAVGRTKIACVEPEKFPKAAEDDKMTSLAIQNAALREILRKTSYAASTDDTRKTLRNTLFALRADGLTAVATNGRLLAKVDYSRDMGSPLEGEIEILMPPTACSLLADKAILGGDGVVRIEVPATNRVYAKFICGDTVLRTRLFDDVFPDYGKVIPADGTPATIDRQRLVDAIERASIFSPSGESGYVSLTFSPDGSLRVESQKSDAGNSDETMQIDYKGGKVRMLVAKRYIMPILKAIDDDEVAFHLTSGHSPLMVKCSIPFLAVVMPMCDKSTAEGAA